MSEIALQLEYSVEADVSPAFAWRFRTDVANWKDPPARFSLDGPSKRARAEQLYCRAKSPCTGVSEMFCPVGHSSLNCSSTGRCSRSSGALTNCLDTERN